ncbi:hypothetical protein [Alteraurantiacibacter aquimixticola]|uniref:Uncharacterized protein n=1 Tax=Alteraurantiacibacter aquimixticola TaxID=2489173 RepID=A0A4V4U8D6_9SPHN|nr:hypothetical protein [Alteraurantiacibacter aquimixticola]TIX49530.1 hypothetical protein E5222_11825 [Alteraurantiacibacter aquimixticola]
MREDAYGSLSSLGGARKKKKMVLVVDQDELDQAHAAMATGGAQIMEAAGDPAAEERIRQPSAMLGLAPMDADHVEEDLSVYPVLPTEEEIAAATDEEPIAPESLESAEDEIAEDFAAEDFAAEDFAAEAEEEVLPEASFNLDRLLRPSSQEELADDEDPEASVPSIEEQLQRMRKLPDAEEAAAAEPEAFEPADDHLADDFSADEYTAVDDYAVDEPVDEDALPPFVDWRSTADAESEEDDAILEGFDNDAAEEEDEVVEEDAGKLPSRYASLAGSSADMAYSEEDEDEAEEDPVDETAEPDEDDDDASAFDSFDDEDEDAPKSTSRYGSLMGMSPGMPRPDREEIERELLGDMMNEFLPQDFGSQGGFGRRAGQQPVQPQVPTDFGMEEPVAFDADAYYPLGKGLQGIDVPISFENPVPEDAAPVPGEEEPQDGFFEEPAAFDTEPFEDEAVAEPVAFDATPIEEETGFEDAPEAEALDSEADLDEPFSDEVVEDEDVLEAPATEELTSAEGAEKAEAAFDDLRRAIEEMGSDAPASDDAQPLVEDEFESAGDVEAPAEFAETEEFKPAEELSAPEDVAEEIPTAYFDEPVLEEPAVDDEPVAEIEVEAEEAAPAEAFEEEPVIDEMPAFEDSSVVEEAAEIEPLELVEESFEEEAIEPVLEEAELDQGDAEADAGVIEDSFETAEDLSAPVDPDEVELDVIEQDLPEENIAADVPVEDAVIEDDAAVSEGWNEEPVWNEAPAAEPEQVIEEAAVEDEAAADEAWAEGPVWDEAPAAEVAPVEEAPVAEDDAVAEEQWADEAVWGEAPVAEPEPVEEALAEDEFVEEAPLEEAVLEDELAAEEQWTGEPVWDETPAVEPEPVVEEALEEPVAALEEPVEEGWGDEPVWDEVPAAEDVVEPAPEAEPVAADHSYIESVDEVEEWEDEGPDLSWMMPAQRRELMIQAGEVSSIRRRLLQNREVKPIRASLWDRFVCWLRDLF